MPQSQISRQFDGDAPLVLVTGGAGFIGSHLTRGLLRAGFRVRILDNLSPQIHGATPSALEWLKGPSVEFLRGSVTSRADVRMAISGANALVHLAAETGTGQSMYEIDRYTAVNVQGTATFMDVVANEKNHKIAKVALASSRSIYGEGAYVCGACAPKERVYPDARTPKQLAAHQWDPICSKCSRTLTPMPTREDDDAKPASIYAATKLAQEHLIRIACSSFGIGYVILRLQNVYGEGQSLHNPYTGLLSFFSTRVRRGLELPIFEDGLETRDFVHVSDVVSAFLAALQSQPQLGATCNVGSGIGTTIADVARELSLAFGVSPQLAFTAQYRVGDVRHNRADLTQLNNVLGCHPKIELQDGLKRFATWVGTQPVPDDRLGEAASEMRSRGLMG